MKKFLTIIASIAVAALILLCGCVSDGRDGRDGKDGQDVSIYDIYEAAKTIEGNENLTLDEFLKEYLNYSNDRLDEATGLKATINRSLMSGVSILTRFSYSGGGIFSTKSYSVYTGSGAILWLDKEKGDAYVVTNCHVIYDDTSDSVFANEIRLYLYGEDERDVNYIVDENNGNKITGDDNYKIDAKIIGASVTYDIALLQVTGSEVLKRSSAVAASFSTEEDVYLGESVYAIGNASVEGMSASYGIISKDSEYISVNLSDKNPKSYNDYRVMRITAPINPGNSGGALYNTKGEIVGIVNAKDESEGIDNMGYALPASNVRRLLQLMYDDYVSNGYRMLSGGGVNKALLNVKTSLADSYARFDEQKGVAVITDLTKIAEVSGYPARGKLQVGDFVKGVKVVSSTGTVKEDMSVTRRYHVQDVLFSVRDGDKVILTVERGGEDIEVTIEFNSASFFTLYK